MAEEEGHPEALEALEWVQILLWEGKAEGNRSLLPRSEARLKKYIDIGVARGLHSSILAKATYLRDVDPTASVALYRRAAVNDDCRAQAMLSIALRTGSGTRLNEAAAYFWGRLAVRRKSFEFKSPDRLTFHQPVPYLEDRLWILRRAATESVKPPDYDAYLRPLQRSSEGPVIPKEDAVHECEDLEVLLHLDRLAAGAYAEAVHDLLLAWRPGAPEPEELTKFSGSRPPDPVTRGPESVAATDSAAAPRSPWTPVATAFAPAATEARPLALLYEELAKSVYVIVAAPTEGDARSGRRMAQGSAVAVDSTTLVTNCHIVAGRPAVYLASKDGLTRLKLMAADRRADTCVLGTDKPLVVPVARVRSYATLSIGENVLAIGAPSGFANTLTTGIISQLRTNNGQRLIQTSAAISGGSSGGGLFDDRGNLIGVTSFGIKDAQAVNFAISIDEFLGRR
jgi:S1-C subfamily serine protease